MQRLNRLILVFAVLFALFLLAPAVLSQQFGPYTLMKNGDVFDLLTPLVLIPLYWLLFQIRRDLVPSQSETIVFLVLAAAWAMGQGMHLAGNSIGHLLKEMPESDAFRLTDFYDETLSHIIWHLAIAGLTLLILYRQWHNPFWERGRVAVAVIVAGVLYGLTFTLITLEATTTWLGIPLALLVSLFGLIWGRNQFGRQPLLAFYFIGFVLATLCFAGWWIYWGGLPEPSAIWGF